MTNTETIDDVGEPETDDGSLGAENRARLDRLEALVDEQQRLVETLREQLTELSVVGDDGSSLSPVTRRRTLTAGGLLALLGAGVGTTTARRGAGQANGGGAVYNWKRDVDAGGHALSSLGSLTMAANPTAITDLAGDNLAIDESGTLNATFPDGGTGPSVSDDGDVEVQNVTDINFGYGLEVIRDGDGTVTITDDGTAPTIDGFVVQAINEFVAVTIFSSERLAEIEVVVTDGDGDTVEVLEKSDFGEDCDFDGCSYGLSLEVSSGGDYTATLTSAVDAAGNDGADDQSKTVTVDL